MPTPVGWGIKEPAEGRKTISRSTSRSCQTDDLIDSDGKIVNQGTAGAVEEISETFYADKAEDFTNAATSGQFGKEVTTGHDLNENAGKWAQATLKVRKLPDFPAAE